MRPLLLNDAARIVFTFWYELMKVQPADMVMNLCLIASIFGRLPPVTSGLTSQEQEEAEILTFGKRKTKHLSSTIIMMKQL